MYLVRSAWARACMAVYFSGSVLLSSFVISGLPNARTSGRLLPPLLVAAILMPLHLALYVVLLNARKRAFFRVAFPLASALALASILAAGILFYPDYLRTAFHVLAALYIIFLYRKDLLRRTKEARANTKALYWLSLIMSLSGCLWVLMYGFYGTILRTSGAEYWMLFNLYTVGVIIVGLNATMHVRQTLYTQVCITAASLEVDGRDCTMLLGRKDLLLLRAFIERPGRRATCALIIEALSSSSSAAEQPGRLDCRECGKEKRKATLCPSYRRVYNQVLKVKKILETMDIGTIVPPQNKMNVTVDGWVLRIFENVHLDYQPKTSGRLNVS